MFEQNNSMTYAIYQATRLLQLNPEILILTMGIENAWLNLEETYSTILEKENGFLNPVLVL
jgi:hypothetical protein